jgi:hypothetical protein
MQLGRIIALFFASPSNLMVSQKVGFGNDFERLGEKAAGRFSVKNANSDPPSL